MKKILATVLGVVFAMFAFAGCNMAAADGTATGASGITDADNGGRVTAKGGDGGAGIGGG